MFDTTIIEQGSTECVPYEKTVIEKKAPTDESIRLFNEMREKAILETVAVYEVKNTGFDAVISVMQSSVNFTKIITLKVVVNGKEYVKSLPFDAIKQKALGDRVVDYIIDVYRQLVKEIVVDITKGMVISKVTNK